MKSSWIGIGFSHHSVPSLSNTATRSSTGTAADPSRPHVRSTNWMIACFAGPSRHIDNDASFIATPLVRFPSSSDRALPGATSTPLPSMAVLRRGSDASRVNVVTASRRAVIALAASTTAAHTTRTAA